MLLNVYDYLNINQLIYTVETTYSRVSETGLYNVKNK